MKTAFVHETFTNKTHHAKIRAIQVSNFFLFKILNNGHPINTV